MLKKYILAFICCMAFSLAKLQVATSIGVIDFFVNEIAKDKASVSSIIPKNVSAESYEPTFASMQALNKADLFIAVGLPYEKKWLSSIKGKVKILQLDSILEQDSMHFYISLKLAKEIATLISEELCRLDSINASFYRQNLESLLKDIEYTKKKVAEKLKNMPNNHIIVKHPIFDIYANEYGIVELHLEQHGKKYSIQDIVALTKEGKRLGIKRVFSEHDDRDMKTIAREIGARIIILNHANSEYLKYIEYVVDEVSRAYEE